MPRRATSVLAAAAALGLAAAAAVARDAAPVRGGTLSWGRYADSLLLDPVFNDSNADIWILTNLYDTLLLPPEHGGAGLEPGLARSWTVSPDGTRITFRLRPEARFSDGRRVTADDVRWSLDRARDPANGIWNALLDAIAAVNALDPETVIVRLRHPDPAILPALAAFNSGIMPRAEYLATPGRNDRDRAENFARHPVGSGPFVLASWNRGVAMRLDRNPFYWRLGADGRPLPYLDSVRLEVVPDDATRILKVQSGELDGAEFIPLQRVAELRRDERLTVPLFPSTRLVFANMNVRPVLPGGLPNPLRNGSVRAALDEAVWRAGMVRIVARGLGVPATSFLSHATPLHADVPDALRFDPADARRRLAAAGFAHGFPLTLLILAGNEDEIEIGTCLQSMWSAIGVDVRLQQVDQATETELYRTGAFAIMLSIWTDDIADPTEAASYAVYSPTIAALHSGWHDDVADALFVRASADIDPARRAAEYAALQTRYRDGPMIPLFETPYAVALRRRVGGFEQLPLGNNLFDEAWLAR